MTTPRPQRWWDPRIPMDVMTAVWSAAEFLPMRPGAGAAYQTLFLAVRRVILGRTLTVDAAGAQASMTVSDVVSLFDPVRLMKGRLDLRLAITGIRWGEMNFGCANVVLRCVELRPGTPPVVFAAPVEVTLDVPSVTIDTLLRQARPGMSGQIGDDGVVRLHWARRPSWANVEVDVGLEEAAAAAVLRVTPRALIIAGRRQRVSMGTRDYRLALPKLPPDVEVTDVQTLPGALRVQAVLPQWPMPR